MHDKLSASGFVMPHTGGMIVMGDERSPEAVALEALRVRVVELQTERDELVTKLATLEKESAEKLQESGAAHVHAVAAMHALEAELAELRARVPAEPTAEPEPEHARSRTKHGK